jgi:ketosteroid isomerase-like protein
MPDLTPPDLTPPDPTPEEELGEIQETNERFYRALESRDLEAMEAIWLHADYVRCVHPGWGLLSGWESVRQSWEAIFKDSRELRFTLSDLQVQIEGGLAWVTGTENILSQSQGNISVTAVLATNVYERRGTRWRMVLHHASHILTGEPGGEA